MSLFSHKSKKESPTVAIFNFNNLILGQSYDEIIKHFSGVSIELETKRLSDDFTYSAEIRAAIKKDEKPYVYNTSSVDINGLQYDIKLGFDIKKNLVTCFANVDKLIPSGDHFTEQDIDMKVITQFIDDYSELFGAPKEEVDEKSYSWTWLKDGIKTSVGAEVSGFALKEVESFNLHKCFWDSQTL